MPENDRNSDGETDEIQSIMGQPAPHAKEARPLAAVASTQTIPPPVRQLLTPYLASVGAVILAFFVREALSRSYGGVAPFFTFYPVVFFAALLGGIWAGILATSLATTMALIWIYQPIGHFKIVSPSDAMASTLFLLIGVCMSVMVERYRSRQRRILALDGELALRETRANLEAALASMADAVIISDADGRFVRQQSNFKLTTSGLFVQVECWLLP